MTFRYRLAISLDLPSCVELLRAEASFQPDDRLWGKLTSIWALLLHSPACQFVIWEDVMAPRADRLHGFAIFLVVGDACAQAIRQSPRADVAEIVYDRLIARASPLLTERQIGLANAGEGINLLVMHHALSDCKLEAPRFAAFRPVGLAAFQFCNAGNFCKEVLWEVRSSFWTQMLQSAGFSCLNRFEPDPRLLSVTTEDRPVLMALQRAELIGHEYSPFVHWLFQQNAPLLGLTAAQQRVVRHSLMGRNDIEIAAALGISINAVKQNWRTILERCYRIVPGVLNERQASSKVRGPSVRSALLEYVRQHMEEIRPWARVTSHRASGFSAYSSQMRAAGRS